MSSEGAEGRTGNAVQICPGTTAALGPQHEGGPTRSDTVPKTGTSKVALSGEIEEGVRRTKTMGVLHSGRAFTAGSDLTLRSRGYTYTCVGPLPLGLPGEEKR